jgi:hypothetical protein
MLHVYQVDWTGTGSNVLCVACSLFFGAFIIYFLRVIVRNIHGLRRDPTEKSIWAGAAKTLLSLLSVIGIAVAGGVAAQSGGPGSGAMGAGTKGFAQGYSSRVKLGNKSMLAVSLLGFPLLIFVLIQTVLLEAPLEVAVSPTQVGLLYRLPWRDRWMPISSITDVDLKRHDYFENGITHSHFYLMTINSSGSRTKIWANQRPWYEDQIQKAYKEIETCRATPGNPPP